MITGVVTDIEAVDQIDHDLQKILITMEDLSSYFIFGQLKDFMEFVNKEVMFHVRKDVINGQVVEVICDIAIRSVVQTVEVDPSVNLDEIEIASMIPDTSKSYNVITFNKDTIKSGDVALSQIILVVGFKEGKSRMTSWTDFTCLDVNSSAFNLRLFTNADPSETAAFRKNIVGHYAMVDIKCEPKYGLQVHANMSLHDQEVITPPEVSMAAFKLSMIIRNDPELKGYVDKYNLLDTLKGIIYFEPGYHIVEIMADIMMIRTVCNIFEGFDKKLLYRAAIASRGYLLGSNINVSNPIVNYHRLITSPLKDDLSLIRLLDITNGVDEGDINKQAFLSIRKIITSIMKERRGLDEAHALNGILSSIDSEYSGMFKRGLLGLD